VDTLEQADAIGIVSNMQVVSNMQDSPLSQSSGISAISHVMSERFILSLPTIRMEGIGDTATQRVRSNLRCAKCSEDLSSCLPSRLSSILETARISCIEDPRKLCPIYMSRQSMI